MIGAPTSTIGSTVDPEFPAKVRAHAIEHLGEHGRRAVGHSTHQIAPQWRHHIGMPDLMTKHVSGDDRIRAAGNSKQQQRRVPRASAIERVLVEHELDEAEPRRHPGLLVDQWTHGLPASSGGRHQAEELIHELEEVCRGLAVAKHLVEE